VVDPLSRRSIPHPGVLFNSRIRYFLPPIRAPTRSPGLSKGAGSSPRYASLV